MISQLRLGFHYHTPAFSTNPGAFRVAGYLGRFLDELADRCEVMYCFLHMAETGEIAQMDYQVRSENLSWINLGTRGSVPRRIISARKMTDPIRAHRNDIDLLLIRGPTPLLPAFARAAGETPTALLLVGDYVAGIDDLPQPGWRKEMIRLWARWNKQQQMRVAKRSLTFVNSHKLYEELQPQVPELVETRTTTLTSEDFYEREDTCQQPPYHLLYTGRLDRGKGLADMARALRLLMERGFDACLDIVGWSQPGDPILDEVMAEARGIGLGERVRYHGFKPLGEELFAYYKRADIYVIGSRLSEGFPRTIWEAMAHSVPVVATRVGSIPAFIEGAAMLVQPGKPQELADGIQRLIEQPEERRWIIKKGVMLARQNTLEAQTDQMINEIQTWLNSQRR